MPRGIYIRGDSYSGRSSTSRRVSVVQCWCSRHTSRHRLPTPRAANSTTGRVLSPSKKLVKKMLHSSERDLSPKCDLSETGARFCLSGLYCCTVPPRLSTAKSLVRNNARVLARNSLVFTLILMPATPSDTLCAILCRTFRLRLGSGHLLHPYGTFLFWMSDTHQGVTRHAPHSQ